MRIDEDTLRAALAPSPECPGFEDLATFADASADARDRRVAAHVSGCARCRAELDLLAEFEAASPRPEEELPARWITARLEADVARMTGAASEPARATAGTARATAEQEAAARPEQPRSPAMDRAARRWNMRAVLRPAVVALAAAAAVVVVLNLRRPPAPSLSPDAGAGATVFRSTSVTLVAPEGDVAQAPEALRWEPVPGAASYSVTLTEVDRTEVWRAEVRSPEAPLPPAVRARVVPGKPFLWQVTAKDASGDVVATSSAQRFRMPPSNPPVRP
ncbi:MAG TPA: hypothetical protein VFL83_12330 [Anaeromyxobacter sp.]|nr:hypothetical protein [Anaeromyxobacter sp.]